MYASKDGKVSCKSLSPGALESSPGALHGALSLFRCQHFRPAFSPVPFIPSQRPQLVVQRSTATDHPFFNQFSTIFSCIIRPRISQPPRSWARRTPGTRASRYPCFFVP